MLDYFANFPKLLEHYIRSSIPNFKTILRPSSQKPSAAFLITRERTALFIKANHKPKYYNTRLEQIEGAPTFQTTQQAIAPHTRLGATSFNNSIQKRLDLNQNNAITFVLDDPKTILYHYATTSEVTTPEELEERLRTNPVKIISGWNDYQSNNQYIWEILTPNLTQIKGDAPLPESVLICGYPEAAGANLAQWCDSQNIQLTNIISLTTAILFWARTHGPTSGYLLIIITNTDHATIYIKGTEIIGARISPSKDHFHTEHIAQVDDLIEENHIEKSIPIWTFNFPTTGLEYSKLIAKYPNTKTLDTRTLANITPIDFPDEIIPESELWILHHLLG